MSSSVQLEIEKYLPLFTNSISIIASIWVIGRLCALHPAVWKRIFPRQLLQVAIADLLYSLFIVAMHLFPHSSLSCKGTMAGFLSGMYTSCLTEMLIACGLACAYWRRLQMLKFISKMVVPTWLIGIGAGAGEAWMSGGISGDKCRLMSHHKMALNFESSFIIICFVVALLANVASWFRVLRFPERVQTEVWRSAWVWTSKFLIIYSGMVAYFLINGKHHTKFNPVFLTIASALESLGGFANMICYFLLSHRARQMQVAGLASGLEGAESSPKRAGNTDSGVSLVGQAASPKALAGGLPQSRSYDDGMGSQLRQYDLVTWHVGFHNNATVLYIPSRHEKGSESILTSEGCEEPGAQP